MISGLEKSSIWKVLKDEGGVEAVRNLVLRQGKARFGRAARKKVARMIESITNLTEIERLADKLLEVSSWDELLADSRDSLSN